MSAPQHISALPLRRWGTDTQVGYLALWSRRVDSPANWRLGADKSAIWRWGADLSAPQRIAVREPTGRFPRKLPLGTVADMSAP